MIGQESYRKDALDGSEAKVCGNRSQVIAQSNARSMRHESEDNRQECRDSAGGES
jgi:hypothetical protein